MGEPNIFEPRLSFVVTVIVMLSTWMGAIALIRLMWMESKASGR